MPAKKSKKGPTKGSGGKGRRALEGKKTTLPKEQRHWYDKHQKRQRPPEDGKTAPRHAPGAAQERGLLIGRNAVVEALRAGIPGTGLYVANSLDSDDRITEAARLAADAEIPVQEVTRAELDRRCASAGLSEAAHQGIVLRIRPYRYTDPEEFLSAAEEAGTPALIMALDGVTDPHNLGAVVRSAAAFGAHGVIVPERRAAGVTPAAWKTSAGALARVPVAQVTNLTRTLQQLKREGVFVVGLDGTAEVEVGDLVVADGPLAVVLGSEGKGLSRLVRDTCDVVASIPISGVESLNASVAAGIALYAVERRRKAA
jgi:23S rRNA (guanosine2251-2'-O)-methyltransferase